MNTSGQVGAILSLILVAFVTQRFLASSAPLYLTGTLFLFGAVCWLWIDPTTRYRTEHTCVFNRSGV
jgi:MFS-type transporter involved in bile tolerance (Atg22 family)